MKVKVVGKNGIEFMTTKEIYEKYSNVLTLVKEAPKKRIAKRKNTKED